MASYLSREQQEERDEQIGDWFEMAEQGEISEEEAIERSAELLFGPDDIGMFLL